MHGEVRNLEKTSHKLIFIKLLIFFKDMLGVVV